MKPIHELLPRVEAYIKEHDWRFVPVMKGGRHRVFPLAQGEYNLNYRVETDSRPVVFRVNIGTQIGREDQIEYEYKALELLSASGVTPLPYFVDNSKKRLDHGVLIMEYLPGEPLDYREDLFAAAGIFSKIHQVSVLDEMNHLIREEAPLTLIYEECKTLLNRYFDSGLADPAIAAYLRMLLVWADAAREKERWYAEDPFACIVNTEVNSGNFIVNRKVGTLHLVDWEMPRWGDPSQDLAHFGSPFTTLWKSDYRMSESEKQAFIRHYAGHMSNPHLRDTIFDRVRLREPFVYLRGISWSAMGWAAYQQDFSGVKNPDTWETLKRYMRLSFIRGVFDPIFKSG
jgi:thiamine kinase-like enzyme